VTTRAPLVDERDQLKALSELHRAVPGYTPEWSPAAHSKASAVMQVFARYIQSLIDGLNQVPERSLLAFLDMMGTRLLPAQAARAPLVFTLIEGSPVDVTLPANSQVAAAPRPIAPSALQPNADPSVQAETIIFATTKTVTLSRGRLEALYSIQPGSDEYADHTERLTKGFTLFDDLGPTEHAIYLGHDQLFALAGDIMVLLSFTLEAPADRDLKTTWEYLSEAGWLPFESLEQEDTTQGLKKDGQIVLRRRGGANAKKEKYLERASYWLRGRLTTPLLPEGAGGQKTVPVINDIRARVGFSKSGLWPEAAFADGVSLDTTKHFYPFGQQPARYSTFYLTSKEVFQRKGATVGIKVELSEVGRPVSLKLEWEYYSESGWTPLGIKPASYQFTADETISFVCPRGWIETKVNGASNYWLRVRIAEGDYGQPVRANVAPTHKVRTISAIADKTITVKDSNLGYTAGEAVVLAKGNIEESATIDHIQDNDKLVLTSAIPASFVDGTVATPTLLPATIQPPVISKLTLGYTYLTDPEAPDHCLSQNDFVFEDHSEACRWPDQTFKPFRPVADNRPAVHLGFDRQLPVGLISLYVDVPLSVEYQSAESSPFVWEYRSARGWAELGVLDETFGFRRNGMIQFIGPPDAVPVVGLGDELFRVRARLKQGERPVPLPVAGIWLNAVWAAHSAPIERELLGTSDGNPGQTFFVRKTPVLEREELEVQEWVGRGEHWRTVVQNVPESELRFEYDPATREVTAVWVPWRERSHLFDSGPDDRHYIIERARGLVRFGDGARGLIPPAGSRLSVSYRNGGGLAGNVPAGTISELRTGVPFLASATNPAPASGGAATESPESVRERGPQRLRHRDRAMAATDFEWLAREASPDVALARCLPITGPAGHAQRGWVTLVVVPHSPDARPQLTPEFLRRVQTHLARLAPVAVGGHVRIIGPEYATINVRAEIVPKQPDEAAKVEARVRERLNLFLHPLTGGPGGQGWDFGQSVFLSQIARVIEESDGVDYARRIVLSRDGQIFGESVPVETNALPAAGDHELKLVVGEN